MSVLTLVRHGQASFLADNYDQLSPLGEQQALRLADYWLARGERFDAVFYGPRERQIRTGEIIAARYREQGIPWPEPVILEDLDEYPAEDVVRTFAPELAVRHDDFREWAEQYQTSRDDAVRRRALDLIVRETTRRWMSGEVGPGPFGTWHDFIERVHRAVDDIRQRTPKSGRSAAFTSGGPAAATAQLALSLHPEKTFDLTWMTRNCALAEYWFSGPRFTLSTFNAVPHLDDEMITYR